MKGGHKHISGWCGLTSLVVIFALCAPGCGGPFTGTVSGKVTYKGNPVPGGIITFIHPDGRNPETRIQEDGTYTIDAPGGDVKVTVNTIPPKPGVPPFVKLGGQKMSSEPYYPAGKYIPIPKKYGDASSTPLTFTVKRSNDPFNIELSD
jgi:hypothetical protein